MAKQLSILIPTYNRAEFLFFALEGLTKQTFKDFKVIIYDDGSDDNTLEIVKGFMNSLEIHYIKNEKNNGVAYARNELMKRVDTPYFAWQDSDDISQPYRLEAQMLQNGDFDGCFSYAYFFKHPNKNRRVESKIDVSKYKDRQSLYKNILFATGLFKADVTKTEFNKKLLKKEDVDWLCKLLKKKAIFTCVTAPLYYIRQHSGRLTTNENKNIRQ